MDKKQSEANKKANQTVENILDAVSSAVTKVNPKGNQSVTFENVDAAFDALVKAVDSVQGKKTAVNIPDFEKILTQ